MRRGAAVRKEMTAVEKGIRRNRPDHDGTHRKAFECNKKKILVTETICGICGQPVDKTLKYPNPMSPCIDHIIPIDRSGHPSDISNLQLAHWKCNRAKANKLIATSAMAGNRKTPTAAGAQSPGTPTGAGGINAGKPDQSAGLIPGHENRNLPLAMDWSTYKAKS